LPHSRISLNKSTNQQIMSAGTFSGNPKTEWLNSAVSPDRDMRILEDFSYEDPSGRKWRAPANSVINGASIPTALWSTVGSPYTGDYRCASIVHDVACDDPSVNRKEADKMFYFACLAGGCSEAQSSVLYIGVRIGSWSLNPFHLSHHFDTEMKLELPGVFPDRAVLIQDKFARVLTRVNEERRDLTFDELEGIVDEQLANGGGPLTPKPPVVIPQ
jgi:hypothetical protein